jgi:hypothetical protein
MIALISIGLTACSKPEPPVVRSPTEVDELVEEIWIKINEWKPVPLDQWLSQSEQNEIAFLTREEAARLADVSLQDYAVELMALVDNATPNDVQFLAGQVHRLKDRAAYTKVLMSASADSRIEVEYGRKWVIFSDELDEDGATLPK